MTCNDFDALLCDYVDGTLPADRRVLMEVHLSTCNACAELTRDTREVLGWAERSADVSVPPELVTKILQRIPQGGWLARTGAGISTRFLSPLLQPRIVMGAMMTLLSLSMMTRCAGAPKHGLTASDLDPVRIFTSLDDRIHRTWERSVKSYESMKLVYEVQARVSEWTEKQREEEEDSRRLPKAGIPTPGKAK